MSTRDQQGKDPESGEELRNLRKLYDDVMPSGRVIISVTDSALKQHHVVVPIPKSYEAAMTIVFDQLGGHIPMSGGASLLEGAYFQYWMRSPAGGVIWAKLPPEFWKELVKDGDLLKLSFPQGEQVATFVFFDTQKGYGTRMNWVIVPVPKTYEEAVQVALGNFQSQGLTTRNIGLRRISNGAEEMHYHSIGILNEKNWMLWVTSDVPVEIGVTNNGR